MPSLAPSAVTITGPLMLGSRGTSVEALQRLLKQVTVFSAALSVDGAFGVKTDASVRAFQRQKGLIADGIVGANTAQALGASFVRLPQPPAKPTPPGTAPSTATATPAAVLMSTIHKCLKQIARSIDDSFNNGLDDSPEVLGRARNLLRFAVSRADLPLSAAAQNGLSARDVANQVVSALFSMADGLVSVASHVEKNGGDASGILAILIDLKRVTPTVADVVKKTLEGMLDSLKSGITLLHDLLDPLAN